MWKYVFYGEKNGIFIKRNFPLIVYRPDRKSQLQPRKRLNQSMNRFTLGIEIFHVC